MKTGQLHPSLTAMRVTMMLVAAAMALPGCTAMTGQRLPASTRTPAPSPDAHTPFQGSWGYGTDCDFGHYVGLDLVENEGRVTGSWSDGTRVRGSQGQLKGVVRDGRLHVEWCNEGSPEIGGHPQCPQYAADGAWFERRGAALVWFRSHGTEATKYVVLRPAGAATAVAEYCED